MIRLSSHWPVPAGRQSKNSLLRTCCSSKPATLLFHAGQHAGRRLYRWPLPVSADLRRRSRLPEARVAQLVEQRIENPRVGGSNPPPGTTHLMYITDMSAFYVLTGQVAYRMTYNQSSYIRVRFGIYHFVRRVPADVQQYYRSDRVSISLRTKSHKAASRAAQSISQRLDDYWHGLRLQKMEVPALHLLIDDKADVEDKNPTLLDAVEMYLLHSISVVFYYV